MTYVQYINCDKWKKVIAITLWSAGTLGLIVGLYFGIEYFVNPLTPPSEPPTTLTNDEYNKELSAYSVKENDYYQYVEDSGINQFKFVLIFIANIKNVIGIWLVINNHYKFIELRCGVKPINRSESQ